MRKRGLTWLSFIVLIAALSVFAFGGIAMAGFSDVAESHWAAKDIIQMSELGVAGGYTDGTFRPYVTVKQVEALSMVVRVMGLKASSTTDLIEVPFPVPTWAQGEAKLAVQHGLLDKSDQFSANSGASRAWVARLLVRMIGKESEAEERLLLPNFTDSNQIPDWALYYVRVAQDNDLIAGYNDRSFRPNNEVNRAELVTFLSRAMESLPESGTVTNSNQQAKTTLSGTVVKIYAESDAFVLEDISGGLKTLYLPGGFDISVTGSSQQGLNALQPGDEVEVGLNSQGYVISIVVQARTGMVGNEGVVYDLDMEARLLTLQSDNNERLSSFRLSDYVSVRAEGVRFPTINDIRKGDRVKVTVQDGWVTGIEVLELASQLKVTGNVLVLDEDNGVITLDVDGQLCAYKLSSVVQVTSPGLSKAFLSDVDEGDTVTVEVDSGEIIALEISGQQDDDIVEATVYAVDTQNRVLTLIDGQDKLKSYDVLKEARITVDGKNDSLSDLERDMEVTVRLLDGDIIAVEIDDTLKGTIVSIDEDGLLLVLQRDNGERKTYVIDKDVDVESKDSRDELDEIKRGDYASIVLDNNRVEEINLRTLVICRVENVREVYDRLEVVDEDGDSLRLSVRGGVDLIVPGITYPNLDDVHKGDLVRATYLGRDLEKVEVIKSQLGEVTFINTSQKKIVVKLFSGKTTEFSFATGSRINSNGRVYDSLSTLDTGDRVEVLENPGGGYTFMIMKKLSGKLAFDMDDEEDKVYLESGSSWNAYKLNEDVYAHNSYGTVIRLNNIKKGQIVDLYMLRDMVCEIAVK
ncbi:S-layer homology domain-containing protein [Desulfoscipio gibsoniae]|uniref:Putative S-layer protein n=1 Tax=Desulfoscipio gibsoniae DSM 7213 TaxID=767817 RepID=R4KQ00_9FIRM|nr:S-layer homology domain-containing protein [Desulfoscipio gibsoniae]AGL03607.1 putative S-layer protein [Desulfoscipio gibsoniae DSM 7213]